MPGPGATDAAVSLQPLTNVFSPQQSLGGGGGGAHRCHLNSGLVVQCPVLPAKQFPWRLSNLGKPDTDKDKLMFHL